MRVRSVLGVGAACALLFSAAACSDSSGPGTVDAAGALQSLAVLGDIGSGNGVSFSSRGYGALAPILDQVEVTIDGHSQTMYALGLRETFPPGTCEEDIFITPGFPPAPGECTQPDLGILMVMWQSHSANQPPDRVLLIGGDTGPTDFGFGSTPTVGLPAFAFYAEGQNRLWASSAGTMNSSVTPGTTSCALPLPPYAKSATCTFATFNADANITLDELTDLTTNGQSISIQVSSQSMRGIVQAITETQPVTLTP